jgi:hypothetical protein
MHFPMQRLSMSRKNRDQQIVVRIAAPLRSELEAAASADGRTLAGLVRLVLIDFASQRLVSRLNEAA